MTEAKSSTRLPSALMVAALAAATLLVAPPVVAATDEPVVAPRGQDVTITQGEERTVYEYRQNGELRMIRVEPRLGRPYYLVPADATEGYGNLEEADMLIPKWILLEF